MSSSESAPLAEEAPRPLPLPRSFPLLSPAGGYQPPKPKKRKKAKAAPSDALLIRVPDFAVRICASEATVRKLIDQGMPVVHIGRHLRIEPAEAMNWLRSQRRPPEAGA